MARYSFGIKSGNAGTSARPLLAIHAAAAVGGILREVGITNTTTTTTDMKLVRLTAAGTATSVSGTTLGRYNEAAADASCTIRHTYTADATVGDDLGYRASLGAAIGSGVIWTFGDTGLIIPVGTGSGIGVIPADGATGQVCQIYFVWDE